MSEFPEPTPFQEGPGRKTMGGAVSWKKILLFAALGTMTITVLVAGVFGFMIWNFLKQTEKELFANDRARTHVAAVVADLEKVRGEPFFMEAVADQRLDAPSLDAGPVLNRMLTWTEQQTDNPPAAGGLELPNDIADKLDDWGESWADHAADFSPAAVDFSWMAGLKSYRYWSLEADSPLGDALARDPKLDPMQFPTPEYQALTAWVKLRQLAAMRDPDPKAGLADVRHLTHLVLTTPTVVAQMLGVKYMVLISEAERHLGLPTFDLAALEAAHRSLWGQQGYFDFTVPDELYDQVYPQGKPHPGACAALEERLTFAAFTRETLGPFYEKEFARFEARLAELQKGCRVAAVRRHYDQKLVPYVLQGDLFQTMGLEGGASPQAMPDGGQWAAVKKISFVRHVVGLMLASLGKTDGLAPYDGEVAAAEAAAAGEDPEVPVVED